MKQDQKDKTINTTFRKRYKATKRKSLYFAFPLLYMLLFISFTTVNNTNNSQDMEKVQVGSKIPSFELKDQHGNLLKIDSVLGKKNLVIYFYPKDDTPGCTTEACSFRDQFQVFEDADAMIIGISADGVESHLDFAKKYKLNFTLLSDEGNAVRKLFGVPKSALGLLAGRVTYIVNKEGKVVFMFDSLTQAEKHVSEALRILKDLK